MEHKIKLLIADDHAVVRLGLAALFSTQKDMEVVAKAKNGEEAVELAVKTRPARTGRNPATGETIQIKAKKVAKFTIAKAVKDAVL